MFPAFSADAVSRHLAPQGHGWGWRPHLIASHIHIKYFATPNNEISVLLKWLLNCVPSIFSGCCQQTFSAPRHFPPKSSAKFQLLKDGVLPETRMRHSRNTQNSDYYLIALLFQPLRPRTWPAWQTEHAGREGRHIRPLCAVDDAADALHQRQDHRNQQT